MKTLKKSIILSTVILSLGVTSLSALAASTPKRNVTSRRGYVRISAAQTQDKTTAANQYWIDNDGNGVCDNYENGVCTGVGQGRGIGRGRGCINR